MRVFIKISLALLGLGAPGAASAQGVELCPLGFLSCATDLAGYIEGTLIAGPGGIQAAFAGVLFAMLIFYGLKLAISAREEEAIGEAQRSYTYAVVGALTVAGAYALSGAFVGTGASVNIAPISGILGAVILAIKSLVTALLIANLTIQGIRLIVAQDDSQRSKARTLFLYSMIGAAMLILADSLLAAFSGETAVASAEGVGIANFLGTVFGLLAVVAIIVGGIMFVLSVDEQLKERGKTLIKTGMITLAVVLASYLLVRTFIFGL